MELARAYKFRFYPDAKRQLRMNLQLAHPAYGASLNRFIQMLPHKAESAGMKVIKVDPRNTTQECSRCHYIKKGSETLTLKDRIYHCNVCGLIMDRDENASINIRYKSRAGLARSHARGDAASAVQQEPKSRVDELRTYSAGAEEAPTFR